MKRGLIWYFLVPVILIIGIFVTPVLPYWAGIPGQVRLYPGTDYSLYVQLPFSLVDANGVNVVGEKRNFLFNSEEIGKQYFQVRLFGIIPVKEMVVDVVPRVYLFPGGQSIGVLVNSLGLVISRVVPVRGLDGKEYFPAASAGIQAGDVILKIGNQQVSRPGQVGMLINQLAPNFDTIPILIRRNEQILERHIKPVLSLQEDYTGKQREVYLVGFFLEDPAAGVGTLTFYDPETGRYGALGHTITDGFGRDLEISQGSIVQASINSIKQGLKGLPGEKLGVFQSDDQILGTIDKNTKFGIFGNLQRTIKHEYFPQPIAVALSHEVQVGPAKIYTVINGDQVEEFDIEITRVIAQPEPDDKGLIIRVTDPRLLSITGGIVQGMSGSPIVQNNKLIGAVTHVFINNPVMGYGSFIEWMIYEAGLADEQQSLAVVEWKQAI